MSSGSEYGDYQEPRDDWIRSLLTRILYLLVLVATFILLICWFLPLVKERQRQQYALQTLKLQVEQERATYNKQSKKLTLLQNDAQSLHFAEKAERAAARSLTLAGEQFKLGGVSYLSVLSAEQSYQNALLALIQARAARFADRELEAGMPVDVADVLDLTR